MCLQYGCTASFSYPFSQAAVNIRCFQGLDFWGVRSFRCFSRPLLSWACPLCPGLPGCFLAFLGPMLFSLRVSSGSGRIKDSTS